MEFPGFENIFELDEPFATRPYRGSLREARKGLDWFGVASGLVSPAEAVRIVPYGGRNPGDFVWTDAVTIRLVSHRVLALFRESRIVGWSTFPVEVYDRGRNRIGGLEGLAVTGRCGKIDPAMSTRMQKIWPGGVFPSFKGYFFKPESWDGSDMFCPERTAHVFVTSPVRELLRRSKVTNVAFRPIIDIEFGEVSKSLLERRLAE